MATKKSIVRIPVVEAKGPGQSKVLTFKEHVL